MHAVDNFCAPAGEVHKVTPRVSQTQMSKRSGPIPLGPSMLVLGAQLVSRWRAINLLHKVEQRHTLGNCSPLMKFLVSLHKIFYCCIFLICLQNEISSKFTSKGFVVYEPVLSGRGYCPFVQRFGTFNVFLRIEFLSFEQMKPGLEADVQSSLIPILISFPGLCSPLQPDRIIGFAVDPKGSQSCNGLMRDVRIQQRPRLYVIAVKVFLCIHFQLLIIPKCKIEEHVIEVIQQG
mmetsp:Transcript_45748/g.97262  ORF Transcript_45748/g.97262 Transcript_45748/m.97262 type:complete len:234 (+) Transcript_45748:390-1091(+)